MKHKILRELCIFFNKYDVTPTGFSRDDENDFPLSYCYVLLHALNLNSILFERTLNMALKLSLVESKKWQQMKCLFDIVSFANSNEEKPLQRDVFPRKMYCMYAFCLTD